ncbi:MAG: DNA polymerase I, partial [Treponema sp.]|nr:DNA polymerase I [Treponema sp.]
NVASLCAEGYEADDVIATLAVRCKAEGRECYVVSADKDLLQLVGDGVYALRPAKSAKGENVRSAGPAWELVDSAGVREEWGVGPEGILDLLSLCGDAADNVPGVKGIGEKTAAELLARHGSLDGIYRDIAGISGARGKKLAEGKESAYFSKSLIRLETAVPLPFDDLSALSAENLRRTEAAEVLAREGIHQSAKQLAGKSVGGTPHKADSGESGDDGLKGPGTYRSITDIAELQRILAEAKARKLLALDFETDSLDALSARPLGISLALEPKTAYYAPLAPHGVSEGGVASDPDHLPPEHVRELLSGLLADPEMTVVAHNAKYDYKVSRAWGIPRWNCKIRDTMVAAWIADPDLNNYTLDSLAVRFFGHGPTAFADIVPKGRTFDAVSLETATAYSAEDADLCLRLFRRFSALPEPAEVLSLFHDLEMPLLPVLGEMEAEGIRLEAGVLDAYGIELGEMLIRLQGEAWETAGREFNLASPKQLQEVLFVQRGLKPSKKTKTGYSTDADSLQELARIDPLPALILRHRTLAKLKSTYVDTLPGQADRNGRLHTTFDQCGAATGRLASRDPNLQNIPIRVEEGRRIRRAFTAAPGRLLISADYNQIELVVLAHLSGDANLVSAFRDGTDVHARTAALIFGIPEDRVLPEQRRIAKTINFGVMYGMSAFRLSGELGITRSEASGFIEAYFATYSGVRAFIGELVSRAESTGYARTILGRRRRIMAINSANKTEKAAAERIAVNTPIQGSAADIVKKAMLNLDARLAAERSPARLLLQVHDELILECPADTAEATAALVKDEMERAMTLSVPLRASVQVGSSWGDFH